MTNYKVAMVLTDSFHNDIDNKNYKYGSPNKIDDKSKPIILYYFLDDYERVWDEGNPITYDDEKLKNNASVTQIDYTDKVLLITLFNFESFEETSLKFEVGKETSIPEIVDENDHSQEYKFTPTKIVVADGLLKDTAVFNEIISSVWEGYYSKQKDGEKLPKVAENVQNAESHSHKNYKKCAECSDSVFGLEEEICFECSSFGAESDKCPVCKGDIYGDMSMIGEEIVPDICGDCDIYVMPQGSDFKVRCIECGYGDIYGSRTPCEECESIADKIEAVNYSAETFEAEHRILSYVDYEHGDDPYTAITILLTDDSATIENANEIIDNLVDEHGYDPYTDEGDKDLTIYFKDIGGKTLRTLNYNVKGNKANDAIFEWFSDYDYPIGGYTAESFEANSEGNESNWKKVVAEWDGLPAFLRTKPFRFEKQFTMPPHPNELKVNVEGYFMQQFLEQYVEEGKNWYETPEFQKELKKFVGIYTDERLQEILEKYTIDKIKWDYEDVRFADDEDEIEDADDYFKRQMDEYMGAWGNMWMAEKNIDNINPFPVFYPTHVKFVDEKRGFTIYEFKDTLPQEYRDKFGAENEVFNANAKSGDKVYVITSRCEDYSAYRELDMAVFGSKTEAKKKFNMLFKRIKNNDDELRDMTIAEAKSYMYWGEYWGIESFGSQDLIYELRECIVGEQGDFWFDAETFDAEYEIDKMIDLPLPKMIEKIEERKKEMSGIMRDSEEKDEDYWLANTLYYLYGQIQDKATKLINMTRIEQQEYEILFNSITYGAETFESESDCREAKEEVKKLRRKIALLDKLHDKENALHHEILGSGGFFKEHELKGLFSEKDLENYEYWS